MRIVRLVVPTLLAAVCAAVGACAASSAFSSSAAAVGDAGRTSDASAPSQNVFSRVNSLCNARASASQSCNPDVATSCGGSDANVQGCVVRNEAALCTPVGAKREGDACSATSECGAALGCVYTAGSGATCQPLCCASACSNPSLYCALVTEAWSADAGSPHLLPVCVSPEPCERSAQACGTARSCEPVGAGRVSCVTLGSRRAGESCARGFCARGLACVGIGGERTCLAVCSLKTPSCGGSEICVRSTVVAGDSDVGYCIDPNIDRPK